VARTGYMACCRLSMRTDQMLAVFATPERAQSAIMRLLEAGISAAHIRSDGSCSLRVAVGPIPRERLRDLLVDAGALDTAMAEDARAASWFSHQQGHITGTGVEPGAGDSEAGVPSKPADTAPP
jgi:hypothetical protein